MKTWSMKRGWLALAAFGVVWGVFSSQALALTPDSPEVKVAIERGIAFLRTADKGSMGHHALVGLTFTKFGLGEGDPVVDEAVKSVVATAQNAENLNDNIYPTGIAIMFLCELDPSKYRGEIEALVKSLHRRQKPHGAWGYANGNHAATCDTSMTQYAVLGLWEAQETAGVETPPEVWERVAAWLILTQSPEGGYGYQGNPSTSFDQRVKQDSNKHSMTAAAMGSYYIVKDRVGLGSLKKRPTDDTPKALRPFETPEEQRARLKTNIDVRYYARVQSAGDGWLAKNFTIDKPSGWLHYYLYALERYQSLRAVDKGIDEFRNDSAPRWYDLGARFLLKTQGFNGAWEGQAKATADTCFSVMFLLRSTQKTLEKTGLAKFDAGLLRGGRGLPDANEVRLRDGKLVVKPLDGSLEQVLAALSNPNHPQFAAAVEALEDQAKKGDPAELKEKSQDLAALALKGKLESRLAALRAIRRSRNLDQVPLLIYLLNEDNPDVMREARDSLRVMSRKFDGIGPSLRPTDEERADAIRQWKDWYKSVRPDANLDVFDPSQALSAR